MKLLVKSLLTLALWIILLSFSAFMIWYTVGFEVEVPADALARHSKWVVTGIAVIAEVFICVIFTDKLWRSKNDNAPST